MFFPELITKISSTDKVLEIGPGSMPHPRSDVYLEKRFEISDELFKQRGKTEEIQYEKPIFYYDGNTFPFRDKEFDYVICSHVIEHTRDVNKFISEMCRVSQKGYLEFPTIYYDYLYNFFVHVTYVFYSNSTLYWMNKDESEIDNFISIQDFFYKTLENSDYDFINKYKSVFFQGFEWEYQIRSEKASKIDQLCYSKTELVQLIKYYNTTSKVEIKESFQGNLLKRILNKLYRILKSNSRLDENIEFEFSYKEFKKLSFSTVKRFDLEWEDRFPCLNDKTINTDFDSHYIYQAAWAARILKFLEPIEHVDISSSLFFSTIVSAFIPIKFYDFRPANIQLSNLDLLKTDICNLDFADNSIDSLSCLHVIEHIGLGRYGDPLDYDGDRKAIYELKRVLKPGGNLLISVPVGTPKIVFNAHRIYNYNQVIDLFDGLYLEEYTLIPDDANSGMIKSASHLLTDLQKYGCGCFWFKKNIHEESI